MFPDLSEAFGDWEDGTRFQKVTKTVVDYEVTEETKEADFYGFFSPMKPQAIQFKPEGQRQWRWWDMLSVKELALDDIIRDVGKNLKYRVVSKADYMNLGGYYAYELTEAFNG